MSSLQARIGRKTNNTSTTEPPVLRNMEKENLHVAQQTAEKVVSEVFQMALTKMLVDAEGGNNSEKIMDSLKRLKLEPQEASTQFDVTLWKSSLESENPIHQQEGIHGAARSRSSTTVRNKDQYVTRL